MGLFGKTANLSRQEALSSIPRRNSQVVEQRLSDEVVRLTRFRDKKGMEKWLSLFFAIPRKKTFELDDKGLWFWQRCDGSSTIEQIAKDLAGQWDIGPEAARQAVFRYTGLLARRGLLMVEITPSEKGE